MEVVRDNDKLIEIPPAFMPEVVESLRAYEYNKFLKRVSMKVDKERNDYLYYENRIAELVEEFYAGCTDDTEGNYALYKKIDKEWRKLCYGWNKKHSRKLKPDAFERTVNRTYYISSIIEKESRLPGEYLNKLSDELLEQLHENKEQRELRGDDYVKSCENLKIKNDAGTVE